MGIGRASRAGLTVMEIAVAFSIIVILGAVLVRPVLRQVHKSKIAAVCGDFDAIRIAMLQYYVDVGTLSPLDDAGGFTGDPDGWMVRHFITGDGEEGWDGPYLKSIEIASPFGGTYGIDVIDPDKATIDLGARSKLGGRFQMILDDVDAALDDDNDTSRGAVWGDNDGIHMGVNYIKQ